MNQHDLIHTGQIVTCAACSFRAILTNRGPFVRDLGDATVDHLAELDAERKAAEALVERLRQGLLGRAVGYDIRTINELVRCIESEHGI